MNPARKRLRLSPSKPCDPSDPSGPAALTAEPPHFSHDAFPLSLAAGGAEEEEGYLVVEEDATDSSLIITMGRAHAPPGSPLRRKGARGRQLRCFLSLSEDSQLEMRAGRRRPARTRKRRMTEEECGVLESEGEVEIDRQLDQSLETKSRQHNLTTVNVKNIIHVSPCWFQEPLGPCAAELTGLFGQQEVITNEHVVAMMKAAINETEAVPPFVSVPLTAGTWAGGHSHTLLFYRNPR